MVSSEKKKIHDLLKHVRTESLRVMKEKLDKKINSLKYNSKEYNKCEMHFLFPRTFLRKKKIHLLNSSNAKIPLPKCLTKKVLNSGVGNTFF